MPTRAKPAAEHFWSWLSKNSGRVKAGLARAGRGSKRVADEIGRAFDESCPGLVWEISPADDGPWVFFVSANGDRDLFPRVEQVVRAAPKLDGWAIQPFRPRGRMEGVEITLNDQTLAADDVWCEVEKVHRGGAVDLVLHIRGVTIETEDELSNAAMILLDNAIGEYDAVMRVASIDLALLEGRPKKTERFFPLRDLPAFLDREMQPQNHEGTKTATKRNP